MRKHLLKFDRHWIYHFTDKRNILGIKNYHGLLPRAMLNNISYVPGGNQWSINADNRSGMHKYIHLCFLNDHPMEYHARDEGRIDSVWLEISTDVLDLPGVMYCAGVSNQAGAKYLTAEEAIKVMDFKHLFNWTDFKIDGNMEQHNEAKKYEILVPTKIPIELIRGI
jgi:hypothetical protein